VNDIEADFGLGIGNEGFGTMAWAGTFVKVEWQIL
jgi:hypothetical protein